MANPIRAKQERHREAVKTMVGRVQRAQAQVVASHAASERASRTTTPKPPPTEQQKAADQNKQADKNKQPENAPPPKAVVPNARVAADRQARANWVAKHPGQRYVRGTTAGPAPNPATGTTTTGTTRRPTPTVTRTTTGVNAATQAIRDARAVSAAAGERYVRKAGGEKSVNAATQAKRIERAKARKGAPPATQPGAALGPEVPDTQTGSTDWQRVANEYSGPGVNPAWDMGNEDAKYQADTKWNDGGISAADVAKNLRTQLVKAMQAGKTQVVLPSGEHWAATQATLDQIDRNLAEMLTSAARRAARSA
jgi:hypothetical protein